MENAADALKIAFAMLIFVVALSIAISVFTQARATADTVFFMTDITNFYENVKESENHRTVGMDTIIPVIYRYALEDYAVTLIDKDNKVIARYSTATDAAVGYFSTYESYRGEENSGEESHDKVKEFLGEIKNIIEVIDKVETIKGSSSNIYDVCLASVIQQIEKKDITSEQVMHQNNVYLSKLISGYTINGSYFSSPWIGSNKNIVKRIDADVSGAKNVEILPGQKYNGIGLLTQYGNKTFKEYVFEVEQVTKLEKSRYDEDVWAQMEADGEDIESNRHMEIVYVEQ